MENDLSCTDSNLIILRNHAAAWVRDWAAESLTISFSRPFILAEVSLSFDGKNMVVELQVPASGWITDSSAHNKRCSSKCDVDGETT